jgi:hypothetical protein
MLLLAISLAATATATPTPFRLGLLPCTTWTGEEVIATHLNASADPAWDAEKCIHALSSVSFARI